MTNPTPKTQAEAQASIMATFDSNIAEAEAALAVADRNEYVIAWPNGLGVVFPTDGTEPYAAGVRFATTVATIDMPEEAWAFTPIVRNGSGEQASCVSRHQALTWALNGSKEAKATLLAMIEEHKDKA